MKTAGDYAYEVRNVKPEWQGIVKKLLAYAEERGLSRRSIKLGWSLDVNHKPLIHIEVFTRELGVVPQLRYMQSWAEESIIRELRHRLEALFEVPHPQLPTISLTRLGQHPEAFSQLCAAVDWLLEQIKTSRAPAP